MLDGLAFLIIAGYVAVTMYRGNVNQLLTLLGQDASFIEFAIALGLLAWVYRNPNLHPIGKGLITSAFLLIGFRIVHSNPGLVAAFKSIAQGADPVQAFKSINPTGGN